MFSSDTYISRRQKLKTQIKSGLILFLGNDESPMNYPDNTYHFRQDSSFLYYFGLAYPNFAAIIDVNEDKDIIFGNDLTVDDIVWMGKQPSVSERAGKAGIKYTLPLSELDVTLKKAIKNNREIHYLPAYRSENILKIYQLLDIPPSQTKNKASVELTKAVVEQRVFKTDEEISEIEKAVNTTVDMHLTAMKIIKPGMTEAQAAAAVYEVALRQDCQISFPIIATIHGETLHNHFHGNILKSGDMFLLDAGAESKMHYAGDMSSTIPVDRNFTPRQKEIYEITLASHEAAIEALKPGVNFKDIHYLACKTIAQGMKDLGFMKGNIDDAVSQGAHALFFPCGLGHMMGLDVHDMEDLGEVYVGYEGRPKSKLFGLKSLRLARELKPGFVITIEPGIYLIPDLIDLWRSEKKFTEFINYDKVETYKNFGGIRNEEDFLITNDGYRLLGKPLPKKIEDVEAMRE